MTPVTRAQSSLDLFSDDQLTNPYPGYTRLRKQGPAVWMTRHQIWAITRHEPVKAVLADPTTFSSHNGVALTQQANEAALAGTVLGTDDPQHRRLRKPLSRQLRPDAVRKLRASIDKRAAALVDDHLAQHGPDTPAGIFDAAALAGHFVADIVMDLMGLALDTRERLITSPRAMFDLFGPGNQRWKTAMPIAAAMIEFLKDAVSRQTVRPDSWMQALYRAADRGEIEEADVVPLMLAYTTASMDTTIHGLSTTLYLLATHPKQWADFRGGLVTADAVFREALRHDAPLQGFGRRVTRNTRLNGVDLAAGDQIWVLYGSANRDERTWARADDFIVRRKYTADHLAFGHGVHGCAGNHLAEQQAISLLNALAARCTTLEPASEPQRALNNTLRGMSRIPIKFTLAA
ncbi:cytochrome P450 [Streptomyces aculeolatus]